MRMIRHMIVRICLKVCDLSAKGLDSIAAHVVEMARAFFFY